jgi:hypothetical protein
MKIRIFMSNFSLSFFRHCYKIGSKICNIKHQESISSTFYARLFRTKVSCEAFLCLRCRFELLLAQEYRRKCAFIMLVKLTPGLTWKLTHLLFFLSPLYYKIDIKIIPTAGLTKLFAPHFIIFKAAAIRLAPKFVHLSHSGSKDFIPHFSIVRPALFYNSGYNKNKMWSHIILTRFGTNWEITLSHNWREGGAGPKKSNLKMSFPFN